MSYLLNRWSKSVSEIEAGYHRLFDEYLNDMDSRHLIDELSTYASNDEWADIDEKLPLLDDRFLAATRSVSTCIWGEINAAKHSYSADRNWWYFRLPLKLENVNDQERWQ